LAYDCNWSGRAIPSRDLYDRSRCSPDPDFPAANVSNVDWSPPFERQLYGSLSHNIFCFPEADTRERPLLVEKSQMLPQTGFSKAGAGISKTFDISVTGVGQPV